MALRCLNAWFETWNATSLTVRTSPTLCELQLFNDHQALEREFYDVCPKCKKFPADASGHECYHCFSIGGIIDECPKCNGKPWSEEFLTARQEIEGDEKDPLPF